MGTHSTGQPTWSLHKDTWRTLKRQSSQVWWHKDWTICLECQKSFLEETRHHSSRGHFYTLSPVKHVGWQYQIVCPSVSLCVCVCVVVLFLKKTQNKTNETWYMQSWWYAVGIKSPYRVTKVEGSCDIEGIFIILRGRLVKRYNLGGERGREGE